MSESIELQKRLKAITRTECQQRDLDPEETAGVGAVVPKHVVRRHLLRIRTLQQHYRQTDRQTDGIEV